MGATIDYDPGGPSWTVVSYVVVDSTLNGTVIARYVLIPPEPDLPHKQPLGIIDAPRPKQPESPPENPIFYPIWVMPIRPQPAVRRPPIKPSGYG